MSSLGTAIAAIALFAGLATVSLTAAAYLGYSKHPGSDDEQPGTAMRDGDDLVVTVGSPLPPRCLLCGDPSSHRVPPSALLRNLGAHPDSAVALSGSRLPLCDTHDAAQYAFERRVAFASAAAFAALVVNVGAVFAIGGHHSAMTLLPGALSFAAVFAFSVSRRPGRLFVGRATVRHVRIRGAAPALLESLPSLTAEADAGR